jgi:hypothetical protein
MEAPDAKENPNDAGALREKHRRLVGEIDRLRRELEPLAARRESLREKGVQPQGFKEGVWLGAGISGAVLVFVAALCFYAISVVLSHD